MNKLLKQYRSLHAYGKKHYQIDFQAVENNPVRISRVMKKGFSAGQKIIRFRNIFLALAIICLVAYGYIIGEFTTDWNDSRGFAVAVYIVTPLIMLIWLRSNIVQWKILNTMVAETNELNIDFVNKRISSGSKSYTFDQITSIEIVQDNQNIYLDPNQATVIQRQDAGNELVYIHTNTNEQVLLMVIDCGNASEKKIDAFTAEFLPLFETENIVK